MSGNSQQRRKTKKAEERLAHKAAEIVRQDIGAVPEMAVSPKATARLSYKVGKLFDSSIFWGGVGVLIGATASLLSLKYLVVVSLLVICTAVWRTNFFEGQSRTLLRFCGNLFLCLVVAGMFLELWRVLPKPKEALGVDQLVDGIARKFPWLSTPPPAPTIAKPSPIVSNQNKKLLAKSELKAKALEVSLRIQTDYVERYRQWWAAKGQMSTAEYNQFWNDAQQVWDREFRPEVMDIGKQLDEIGVLDDRNPSPCAWEPEVIYNDINELLFPRRQCGGRIRDAANKIK